MKNRLSLFFLLFLVSCGASINQEDQVFQVKDGDTMARVTQRLINDDIIDSKLPFRVLAKVTGKDSKLKIGTYTIPVNTSYNKILKILISGKGVGILITIPEGFNSFQIAALLEDNEIIVAKDFLNEISKDYWLKKFDILPNPPYTINSTRRLTDHNNSIFAIPDKFPRNSLEGYLFPDTYSFEKNMSASNIVATMVNHFFSIVDDSIREQIKATGHTLNEAITLASIIQKEASNNEEMPEVAGVYQNRIDINMILQADPTIIYALILDGEYTGDIRFKHLRPPWPSPYNTYYVNGLPPGPIASPGKDAILATLNPTQHDYYYFVGNPNGKHTFSKTLAEHNKAVDLWVKYRKGS